MTPEYTKIRTHKKVNTTDNFNIAIFTLINWHWGQNDHNPGL